MFILSSGNYEVKVGDIDIPAEMLGDLACIYEEPTIRTKTQAGIITTLSGKPTVAKIDFMLYLPKNNALKYLAYIWPDITICNTIISRNELVKVWQTHSYINYIIKSIFDNVEFFIKNGIAKISFDSRSERDGMAQLDVSVRGVLWQA